MATATLRQIQNATKKYNQIMFKYCWEHCSIGTNYSENTEGWTLRDMVSEAQYHLDTCYEDGNSQEEGRYMDIWEIDSSAILSLQKYEYVLKHNETERELHKEWLTKTKDLRNFIYTYCNFLDGIHCKEYHCSKYDL